MSRHLFFVVALALVLAACDSTGDSTTSSIASPTTTEATTTTATEPTGTTEVPSTTTTTTATTTTSSAPLATIIDIVISGGTVERVERFDVPLNGAVRVTVTADISEEVHLHGYDLRADVTADAGAVFEFDATIPGVFEIELEGSGVLIGELQVAP